MVNEDSPTTYLTRHQPTSVLDRTNLNTVNSRGSHLYVARVEAFAIGIKIDQSPFPGPIKGSRWPPGC